MTNIKPFIRPEEFDLTVPPGWHRLSHLLQPILDKDELYTLEDVLTEIKRGHARFWPGDKSCVVTDWLVSPSGKRQLNFWLAGGELKELKQLAVFIEAWARQQGASSLKITGRRWARALGPEWAETATVSVKDLTDGQEVQDDADTAKPI